MKQARVVNTTRGLDLAHRAMVADTPWTRLRGLLGRPRLQPGQALILNPSRGVHTYGMSYAIDVVFISDEGRVTAVYPELEPCRRTRIYRDAGRVLELPGGVIAATETRLGDQISTVPCEPAEGPNPVSPQGGPR